jgi:uncharacterized protein (DUF983 family)
MTHCEEVTCVDGNCEGCKNGLVFCKDPRCSPNCRGCEMIEHHDFALNFTLIIIMALIAVIFFSSWFIYGPRVIESHSDHHRAGITMPSS